MLMISMLLCLTNEASEALARRPHNQSPRPGATSLTTIRAGEVVAGFQVMAHYTDHADRSVGLRLTHDMSGTPVHLLQMDTVPQASLLIRTYPDSDHGAAHALEHLLIGKGTTGRTLQALADMRLSQITASTGERYTWYHFSAGSGMASLYDLLQHLLHAVFQPDFSDAEAQEEVYQIGVATDVQTGRRRLIEQGTVYTEMQSSQGVYDYWYTLLKLVLGSHHPLTFPAGGTPDGIRHLSAQEIRQFHRLHYQLGPATPLVIVVDRQQNLAQVLATLSAILAAFWHPKASPELALDAAAHIRIESADQKTLRVVPMPSQSPTDPATLVFGWKPAHLPSRHDQLLLEALLAVLGQGNQSVLYRSLVDRQTHELDVEATGIDSLLMPTYDPEWPVSLIWVDGIPGDRLTSDRFAAIRAHIQAKWGQIASYADESPELLALNRPIVAHLTARQRELIVWHTNPPGFGQRRIEPTWIEHLELLESEPGGRRSLVLKPYWSQLFSAIGSGTNIWRRLIGQAGLLEAPYGTAAIPNPVERQRLGKAQRERLAAEVAALRRTYDVADDQEAMRRLSAEQAQRQNRLVGAGQTMTLPPFTTAPPRTFDDTLPYAQISIAGVPAIQSTVDGASLAEIGLAFDLQAVPPRLYRYLPLLPGLLRSIGVKEGEVMTPYDMFEEDMQHELHRLETYYSINPDANRYELAIRASGMGLKEFIAALEAVQRITHANALHPDNLPRITDLLQQYLNVEKTLTQRPEEEWVETLAKAFRHQDNHLFLSLYAQPTRAHAMHRLLWLLAGPVHTELLQDLQGFATRLLEPLRTSSVAEMEEVLASVQETGLRGQLVDYWRAHLHAWPPSLVWEGMQRLRAEVVVDLQVGHMRAIQEMRELQGLILNRSRMRLWLVGDRHLLQDAHGRVEVLVRSFQRQELDAALVKEIPLIWDRIHRREPGLTEGYPAYVGYVSEGSVTGSVMVTAKGPTYRTLDESSLVELLAAKALAGTGPHTWYKKTWEAGLAYGNGLDIRPRDGTMLYYADRCPSVRTTLAFVRRLAQDTAWLSEPAYVDYALAQTFNFSRAGQPWTARAEAMAIDLTEGLTPEQMQRFSQTLLQLRQAPKLLERLRAALPHVVARVTLGPGDSASAAAAQAIFFVIAPERQLAELEADLPAKRLARVWPSDFWLN